MFAKFLMLIIGSYLIGSIPFSFLVAKILKKIDIRRVGSGNPGATNVYRTCGFKIGMFAFFMDALRGFLAVYGLVTLLKFSVEIISIVQIIAFITVVAGHNWTVFLRFKGGKGMATSAGALIAIDWRVCLILFLIWCLCLVLTRYVSFSSIISATILPVMFWLYKLPLATIIFGFFIGGLAIYRHKNNIKRLLKGEESKIYEKKK